MRSDELNSALQREADTLRASGALGEARLRRLFDYLVAQSSQGLAPKEIAIAVDVFGKGAGFDASQDAVVRVYIHKLRRALEDFYASRPTSDVTLQIPRGEYRLSVATRQLPRRKTIDKRVALVALGAIGAVLVLTMAFFWFRPRPSEIEQVRADSIWSWINKGDRPILVVIGDYYLIGETDDSMEVKRLIREYSVNSKSDLERYLQDHPKLADKYIDVGLRYLPTASAFALRDVMPILASGKRRVLVSMMSEVNPSQLKGADIVYIGYLSGLGIMQNLVFYASRFEIGDSYDELVDKKTRHHYISQTASQSEGLANTGKESPYRDYGFFSAFRGPGGNAIVVIAGTRDEGVRETAEMFTNRAKLLELQAHGEATPPFETLLEVSALDGVNLTGKVLVESKLAAPAAP